MSSHLYPLEGGMAAVAACKKKVPARIVGPGDRRSWDLRKNDLLDRHMDTTLVVGSLQASSVGGIPIVLLLGVAGTHKMMEEVSHIPSLRSVGVPSFREGSHLPGEGLVLQMRVLEHRNCHIPGLPGL